MNVAYAAEYDVVLDAMFGFGFKGDPRPPFDTIIRDLSRGGTPVVSVDVPSGWSVSLLRLSRANSGAEGEPCPMPGRPDRDHRCVRLVDPQDYLRGTVVHEQCASYTLNGGMHATGDNR